MAGARTQSAQSSAAGCQASGLSSSVRAKASTPMIGEPIIRIHQSRRLRLPLALTCCAVRHSSRCRRVTASRQSVRAIASVALQAWWAMNTRRRAISLAISTSSCSTRRAWRGFAIPGCEGMMPSRKFRIGMKNIVTNRIVCQSQAASAPSSSQPVTDDSTQAGATSERRRLSSILSRPRPFSPLRRSATKGKSCQSPRIQRCCRATSTS